MATISDQDFPTNPETANAETPIDHQPGYKYCTVKDTIRFLCIVGVVLLVWFVFAPLTNYDRSSHRHVPAAPSPSPSPSPSPMPSSLSKQDQLQYALEVTLVSVNSLKGRGMEILLYHHQDLTNKENNSLLICMNQLQKSIDNLLFAGVEFQSAMEHLESNKVEAACLGLKEVDYLLGLSEMEEQICIERFHHLPHHHAHSEGQMRLRKLVADLSNPIKFGRRNHKLALEVLNNIAGKC